MSNYLAFKANRSSTSVAARRALTGLGHKYDAVERITIAGRENDCYVLIELNSFLDADTAAMIKGFVFSNVASSKLESDPTDAIKCIKSHRKDKAVKALLLFDRATFV